MEKLEKEIINRLNKVLNGYNLEIVSKNNHNYKVTPEADYMFRKYCSKYVLVEIYTEIDNDITIIECHYTWDNIEVMLLSSAYDEHSISIFDEINIVHENIKQFKVDDMEPYEFHIILDNLYNKLGSLNHCFCLEELVIKMDLMGI